MREDILGHDGRVGRRDGLDMIELMQTDERKQDRLYRKALFNERVSKQGSSIRTYSVGQAPDCLASYFGRGIRQHRDDEGHGPIQFGLVSQVRQKVRDKLKGGHF
jgi:hypothetical protein